MNAYGIVTVYPKIVLQGKVVIYSRDYTQSKRRNNFTVSFTDPERPSSLRYGQVQKFFSYPADSPDSMHVAIIEELKVQRCMELEYLNFPPELQSLSDLLCSDFYSVLDGEHLIAIPIEHISSKCFHISTAGLCIITSMVCDSEVLK